MEKGKKGKKKELELNYYKVLVCNTKQENKKTRKRNMIFIYESITEEPKRKLKKEIKIKIKKKSAVIICVVYIYSTIPYVHNIIDNRLQ